MSKAYERCYPSGENRVAAIAGYVLIAVGIILLFICIPGWAWLALFGVALMAAGIILLRISRTWR